MALKPMNDPKGGVPAPSSDPLFRVCIQSGLFRLYPLELALSRIADAGYEGVELWGGQFHGYIPDLARRSGNRIYLDGRRIEAIRGLVERAGLELVCYTPEQCVYPINYLRNDVYPFDGEETRARSRRYVDLSIEAAAALGCRRVVLVSPMWQWCRRGHGRGQGRSRRSGAYERVSKKVAVPAAIKEIDRFARRAEERGVTILFEPLTHLDSNVIETFEDTAALMEHVQCPSLQVMLDTGHVQVTARKLGQDPLASLEEYAAAFQGRIGWVHVDDNAGTVDSHLVPGSGSIDLEGMLAILADHGYRGWLSVELAVLGDYVLPERAESLARQALQHLAGIMPRAGAG